MSSRSSYKSPSVLMVIQATWYSTNPLHIRTSTETGFASVILFHSLNTRLAASEGLFDTMFHEWIKEGPRSKYAESSKGLSSVLSEMDMIYDNEEKCQFKWHNWILVMLIVPQNLQDVLSSNLHEDHYSMLVDGNYHSVYPYTSLKWLYDWLSFCLF